MKKLLLAVLVAMCISAPALAQSPQITTQVIATAAGTGLSVQVPTTGYHQIAWSVTGAITGCTVSVDSSADNSSWTAGGAVPNQTCTSGGTSPVVNVSTNYVRIDVVTLTGGGTLKVYYTGISGISGNSTVSTVSIGAPVGTCANGALDTDKNTGNFYTCNGGTWFLAGAGGSATIAFPVAVSGTVISGGIPYFSSTTVETSSAILNTGFLVKGGGAGGAPTNTLCDEGATTANTITCTNTAGLKVVNVQTGTSPPTCTIGTAGAMCFGEGTAPTGAASVDDIYANSTNHCLTSINNNTDVGCLVAVGATNTAAAAMTLDMSAATTAGALKMPVGAGLTAGASGVIAQDSTNNNVHIRTNSADSIAVAEAAAVTINVIPKATDSTHGLLTASLLTDAGTTLTYAGTGGISLAGSAPAVVTPGTTPYLNMNTLVKGTLNTCTFALTTSTLTLALSPVSLCTWTLPNAALTWYWACNAGYSMPAGTTPTFEPGVTWAQAPSVAFQMGQVYSTNTGVNTSLTTTTTTNSIIINGATSGPAATVFPVYFSGKFTSSATSGTFSPTASLTGTGATGTLNGGCTIQ